VLMSGTDVGRASMLVRTRETKIRRSRNLSLFRSLLELGGPRDPVRSIAEGRSQHRVLGPNGRCSVVDRARLVDGAIDLPTSRQLDRQGGDLNVEARINVAGSRGCC
jgi:hypothetical protein